MIIIIMLSSGGVARVRVTYCAELRKHLAIVHLLGWGLAEPEGREGYIFPSLSSPATARKFSLVAKALSHLLPLVKFA